MRNWRELGEVPDSDDEEDSLDDFETTLALAHEQKDEGLEDDLLEQSPGEKGANALASLGTQSPPECDTKQVDVWELPSSSLSEAQPSQRDPDPPKPTKEADGDIWELPSSSTEEQLPQNPLRSSTSTVITTRSESPHPVLVTPLAQVEDVQGRPSSSASSSSSACSSIPDHGDPDPTPRPAKQPGPSFIEDEISTGYVRTSTPEPQFLPTLVESSPLSVLSSPELSMSGSSHAGDRGPQPQTHDHAEASAAGEEASSRQATIRPERSLRPRKPIQQHPYLLESAHYSKFMKSHGIKPVKVVLPSQSGGRRTSEEDSQEQEFQTEESQERSRDGGTQGDEDMIIDNGTNDQDELSLSPSPPKTSPFAGHLHPSSQPTTADQTDITSVSGDDEFPSPRRLGLLPKAARSRNPKRRPSQLLSVKSKRQRLILDLSEPGSPRRPLIIPPPDPYNLSSSPSRSQTGQQMSQDLGATPRSPMRKSTFVPRSALRGENSSMRPRASHAVDFTVLDQGDEAEDTQNTGADSASDTDTENTGTGSDEDVILKNSRRIRGVLPASWLRLDQQKDLSTIARNRRQSPEPTPRKAPRRGVALPKQSTVGSSSANPFVFSESEESDGDATTVLARQRSNGLQVNSSAVTLNEDDGASVIEEDYVDWMLPGRKRAASSNLLRGSKKPKTTSKSAFGKPPGQFTRQPKITQALSRSKSTAGGRPTSDGVAKSARRKSKGISSKHASRKRASTPPLLSILDVIEPTAPKFIKIAARSARKRPNLGKSSPSKKVISLASRSDNVDALSVLQDWRSGRTRPKVTAPSVKSSNKPVSRTVLQEVDTNTIARPSGTQTRRSPSSVLRSGKQGRLDGFVTVTTGDVQQGPAKSKIPVIRRRNLIPKPAPNFRPAQLESNEDDVVNQGRRLASKKRSLDALFRQSRRAADASSTYSSTRSIHDLQMIPENTHRTENSNGSTTVEPPPAAGPKAKENRKSRFKKRRVPQYIDLETPQYERAHDPLLPVVLSIPEEVGPHKQQNKLQDKLGGLGPYGTHYTHHFEVFPLERGTFFHESTIIGRGYIRQAIENGLCAKLRQQRPTISFVLDAQVLRWGPWSDKTSSELGILFDWISEQVSSDSIQDDDGKLLEAATFVLDYILNAASVQSDVEQAAVILRFVEVLSSLIGRFESLDWQAISEPAKILLLDVVARFLAALLSILMLSQSPASCMAQSMKIEPLLTRFSSFAIRGLLSVGLEELRALYSDLQCLSARERGIRPRHVLANCWVVVMRVLECANIPRSSFWDVAHAVMLKGGVASGLDAQAFERCWQDMFTLLPLGEIDNDGVLIPGLRSTNPLEGWTLPQQLMKRVFQVYKSNPRQSPSFNEYCRSLVARCHCLVQLWGWRKCTGIIGTIFDFFGSQSLAHLRNEEVYRSPRFIEELHLKPSLSIEPEDRCFHIFIKMLGLVIQRLKQLGRENEVKNLVTRTLPNHNRQYLKEDTVHQHDLAALRNHHDLLCTLFWAAPPDRRPPVHLIEKLVTTSRAHKEACVINIKAWNQLARFVVSSGEGSDAFKPFGLWRSNVFNQVLEQYLSAASDIERQFQQLSERMPGISTVMRDATIAKNKATAMDVLHCSLRASLDVLKHAPNLEATVYSFNIST